MKFVIAREQLLQGLQFATGVVERRQNVPILSNVLLNIDNNNDKLSLSIVGTDLEIELTSRVSLENVQQPGTITVSGRKFLDICRALPEDSQIIFHADDNKVSITVGKSRFSLASLPAADFPIAVADPDGAKLTIKQADLVGLLESTHFAMAQQDVRYYLNGLFFELTPDAFRVVATDGHRLALRSIPFNGIEQTTQFIVPRKGITELLRLLNKGDDDLVDIHFSANSIKIESPKFVFISRLIDGRFPDYHRVIPKNGDKLIQVDRDILRQVLQRVAILSNEKYHAVRLHFQPKMLTITANNVEQEEAHDEIAIDYNGPAIETGFNVNYLLDVLSVMPVGTVKFTMANAENSVLIESDGLPDAMFVIMPMSL